MRVIATVEVDQSQVAPLVDYLLQNYPQAHVEVNPSTLQVKGPTGDSPGSPPKPK